MAVLIQHHLPAAAGTRAVLPMPRLWPSCDHLLVQLLTLLVLLLCCPAIQRRWLWGNIAPGKGPPQMVRETMPAAVSSAAASDGSLCSSLLARVGAVPRLIALVT